MRAYIKDMRRRLGLNADDTSRDADLEAMSPNDRLRLLCGYHLGDPGWVDTFLAWARDAGFKIEEPRP